MKVCSMRSLIPLAAVTFHTAGDLLPLYTFRFLELLIIVMILGFLELQHSDLSFWIPGPSCFCLCVLCLFSSGGAWSYPSLEE